MKIYIDFDGTLFDCDRFKDDLFNIFSKYNISKDVFKKCQDQCKKNGIKGFNPYNVLDLVKEKEHFDLNIYSEIDNLIKNAKEYLYQDSIKFLAYLKKLNKEIIILTKGNYDYQRKKIFNSGLDLWYNDLVITNEHKGELKLDYQDGVFIDDNPQEIQSIILNNPKKMLIIQRTCYKYDDVLLDSNILSFKSLSEIMEKKILEE